MGKAEMKQEPLWSSLEVTRPAREEWLKLMVGGAIDGAILRLNDLKEQGNIHIMIRLGRERASCYDCGLDYRDPAWIEAVVDDEVWRIISPTHDEGGLLCINCMARRLVEHGLDQVKVSITAGVFVLRDLDSPS